MRFFIFLFLLCSGVCASDHILLLSNDGIYQYEIDDGKMVIRDELFFRTNLQAYSRDEFFYSGFERIFFYDGYSRVEKELAKGYCPVYFAGEEKVTYFEVDKSGALALVESAYQPASRELVGKRIIQKLAGTEVDVNFCPVRQGNYLLYQSKKSGEGYRSYLYDVVSGEVVGFDSQGMHIELHVDGDEFLAWNGESYWFLNARTKSAVKLNSSRIARKRSRYEIFPLGYSKKMHTVFFIETHAGFWGDSSNVVGYRVPDGATYVFLKDFAVGNSGFVELLDR